MSVHPGHPAVKEISRLAREREVRRELLHARARRTLISTAGRLPARLAEYGRMLVASVVGYWVFAKLIALAIPADVLYTFAGLAILFAVQATSYKVKLAKDPSFEIPGCGCGAGRPDETAAVLRSGASAILGVPNSVFAIVPFAGVIAAFADGHHTTAIVLAAVATAVSAYLGYVMVAQLQSLCATCVNVSALSVLILLHLVI